MHMVQEVTSIFIGIYTLMLIGILKALSDGPEAYQGFLDALGNPLLITFNWIAFLFMLYHSISWFSVTPKAMPIQIGEEFLPGGIIAAGHYIAWLVVSVAIYYLAGGFNG